MTELPSLPLLHALTPEGRRLAASRLALHHVAKGSTIVEKGQAVSGAYFVLEGQLRVGTYGADGREATLYLLEPGETCVLALNALFNDLLYPAWVHAEAETTVGVLPGTVYRDLFARERAVQDLTVRALSTVVFRLMAELEEVQTLRLDQRLARFLLGHASAAGVLCKTQQEIAAHVGTSREVVGRLMADFAARGLVATRRGAVTLLRPDALAALA